MAGAIGYLLSPHPRLDLALNLETAIKEKTLLLINILMVKNQQEQICACCR
jgi:hypothetical protein